MKKLMLLTALLLSTSLHAELFFTNYMACTGTITGNYSGVHTDYHKVAIKMTSFWTLKKNCQKAPSLEAQIGFTNDISFGTENKTEIDKIVGDMVWYGAPLKVVNGSIIAEVLSMGYNNSVVSMFNEDFDDVSETFYWEAYWDQSGTVGDTGSGYGYNLSCSAKKAEADELQVLNTTADCTNYPKKEYLD